jgi:PKD repeat protein
MGPLPASAGPGPTASISIEATNGQLTVKFVAQSAGFSSTVTSFDWAFGDGKTAITSKGSVVHSYATASTYPVSVKETGLGGQTASANGTLELVACPAGVTQCLAKLAAPSGVFSIEAAGPVGPAASAELNLFSGSWRFPSCDSAITPAGSLSDAGFTGDLTVTFSYETTNQRRVQRTCFASTVAFANISGAVVRSGRLPKCQSSQPIAPCAQPPLIQGSTVTKQLLIPPGDPRFGS